ncbi:hypothetical protein M1M86_02330, partial [Dehalococcoidales bacterium]|nr:hypothetical protein [Dehalococcoidales bacterium]
MRRSFNNFSSNLAPAGISKPMPYRRNLPCGTQNLLDPAQKRQTAMESTLPNKLGPAEGERTEGDEAEKASGKPETGESAEENNEEPEPFDGDVPPNDRREGKGNEAIEPKPYIELEEKVKPLVQELVEELYREEKPKRWESVERGGRLSIREYLRDKNHPFLAEEEQGKAPPTLALKVIIDHSTSLNYSFAGKTRMESIAEAVMTLHLVCLELGISHEVLITPQALKIADLNSGERGKQVFGKVLQEIETKKL